VDLVKSARDLIAANSVSSNGSREILPVLCGMLQNMDMALDFQRVTIDGIEHTNLIASTGPHAAGGLLLSSHVDTVDPGDHAKWVECGGNPFSARVVGERIYGLGSASGKLDWLAKVEAARRVTGGRLLKPLHIVATYGEQMGLLGAKQLADGLLAKPDYAIVGEPTGLSVVYANKGYVVIRFRLRDLCSRGPAAGKSLSRVRCTGTPAHSAIPSLGDSAVDRAISILTEPTGKVLDGLDIVSIHGGDAVNRVPDLCEVDILGFSDRLKWLDGEKANLEQVTRVISSSSINSLVETMVVLKQSFERFAGTLSPTFDPAFDPAGTIYNLGMVRSTTDYLEFSLDIRLLPGQDHRRVRAWIPEAVREAGRRHPGVDIEGAITVRADPMCTSRDGRLVRLALEALAEIGVEPRTTTKPVTTEGSVYSARGVETIAFGPGNMAGVVHRPDEFNSMSEIAKAVDFYEAVIRKACM
jgi:acetylornithine deacetylase/succinyl-diaminopimelate desuccinylase-like protein